jgi:DNA end-binding protein Ku
VARAIWTGAVTFGLVTIPVKLYSATSSKQVKFNLFEEGTGERVHYRRVAGDSDQEVPWDKVVKGYEVDDGKFVVVTKEELEGVEPTKTRTLEIQEFVDLTEIDPIYFDKTYYLAPREESGAEKPYALLLEAMERTGKVGIGRLVLRTKEHLAAVRPSKGLLAVETMYFADEVRDAGDIENAPVTAKVNPKELEIAEQLIDAQAGSFDPSAYEDTYRERVLELIERKAKGEEVVVEQAAEPEAARDIMEALRASMEAVKAGKRPRAGGTDGDGRRTRGGSDEDLTSWSKDRLYARAQELDIPGRSDMSKKELVDAIRDGS